MVEVSAQRGLAGLDDTEKKRKKTTTTKTSRNVIRTNHQIGNEFYQERSSAELRVGD